MDKLDRIQQLHQLFISHKQPIKLRVLAEKLECTEKTVRRHIAALQDLVQAPIEYVEPFGWCYKVRPGEQFQLPGLWLTAEELQSMALLLHVLAKFGSGLLNNELKAVEREVNKLLRSRKINPDTLIDRIRVLPLAHRNIPNEVFLKVGEAVLKAHQIRFRYRSFENTLTVRTISPQSLLYYRDNWYLDGWCHEKCALRTFSLARIESILNYEAAPAPAYQVTVDERDEHFGDAYGIFTGESTKIAVLRFRSNIAREISIQQWHPQQEGNWEGSTYVLRFPYGDDRELARDVMRYVPDVVVEGPPGLKAEIVSRLRSGLSLFDTNKPLDE
jgi:proteasome accessory factor C